MKRLISMALCLMMVLAMLAVPALAAGTELEYRLLITDENGKEVKDVSALKAGETVNVTIRLNRTDINEAYNAYGIEMTLLSSGLTYNNDGKAFNSEMKVTTAHQTVADTDTVSFRYYDLMRQGMSVSNKLTVGTCSYTAAQTGASLKLSVGLVYLTGSDDAYAPTFVECVHDNTSSVYTDNRDGTHDIVTTCEDCGYVLTGTERVSEDHNYVNGECALCGAKEPVCELYVEIVPDTDADKDGIIDVAVGGRPVAKLMLKCSTDATLRSIDASVSFGSAVDTVMPSGGEYKLSVETAEGGYRFYSEQLSVPMKADEAIEIAEIQMYINGEDTHGLLPIGIPSASLRVAEDKNLILPTRTGKAMEIHSHTITFVTDGGVYNIDLPEGSMPSFADVTAEGATTEKTGYTFTGWNPELAPVTGAQTYTAQYTAKKYTVTYDVDGGDAKDALEYTIEDESVIGEATRSGYRFIGWTVETADGNWVKDASVAAADTVKGKFGNVTLKAQWVVVTVSFEDYAYAAGDQILLVVEADKLESGSYMFDGQPMYWTDSKDYGANGAYITLVDKAWAKTSAEEAVKALTVDKKAETVKVDRDGDVNGDGKTDVHDAGVVYKMLYTNGDAFKDLTILDRLECDVVTSQANASYRGSIADVNAIMDIYLAD